MSLLFKENYTHFFHFSFLYSTFWYHTHKFSSWTFVCNCSFYIAIFQICVKKTVTRLWNLPAFFFYFIYLFIFIFLTVCHMLLIWVASQREKNPSPTLMHLFHPFLFKIMKRLHHINYPQYYFLFIYGATPLWNLSCVTRVWGFSYRTLATYQSTKQGTIIEPSDSSDMTVVVAYLGTVHSSAAHIVMHAQFCLLNIVSTSSYILIHPI